MQDARTLAAMAAALLAAVRRLTHTMLGPILALSLLAPAWSRSQPEPTGSAASYRLSSPALSAALSIVGGEVSTNPMRGGPFVPVIAVVDEPADATDADDTTLATFAVPAGGDLSGDGRDDVLVVRTSWDRGGITGSEVEARSGADGGPLWKLSFGADVRWGAYLPDDTTGDGVPDLAFVTLEDVQVHVSYPPPGVVCFDCQKWVLTARTRLLSVDGSLGIPVWEHQRTVTYAFNEQPIPADGTLVRTWVSTNLLATLAPAGDVDRDGAVDLAWSSWQSTFAQTFSSQTVPVGVRSGRTGDELWTTALAGTGSTPWNRESEAMAGAWPGPDGSGDGVPDLYTSEIHETPTTTYLVRQGLDGITGLPFWQTERSWPTDQRLLRGGYTALEGEGSPLIYTLSREGGFPIEAEAVDPRTGDVIWNRDDGNTAHLAPVGDIDSDSREDLLVIGFEGGELILSAVVSADGTAISQRRLSASEWGLLVIFGPFVDHSGDGLTDVVVGRVRTAGSSVDEVWNVVSLADGTDTWSVVRNGVETPTFLLPAGDLEGRGPANGADLVAVRVYDHRSDAPRIDLLGVEGTKGKTLWRRTGYRTAPAGEALWRLSVDNLTDVDGDGHADLLVASDNTWGDFSGGDVRRAIEILSGRKGRTHVSLVGD